MSKNVDYTQPIQFADGTKAFYKGRGFRDYHVVLPKGSTELDLKADMGGNWYLDNGKHHSDYYEAVYNVPAPAAPTDKELADELRKVDARHNELLTELNKRGYTVEDTEDGCELYTTLGLRIRKETVL